MNLFYSTFKLSDVRMAARYMTGIREQERPPGTSKWSGTRMGATLVEPS